MKTLPLLAAGLLSVFAAGAAPRAWYTQGNFVPTTRIEFTVVNTLDIERTNVPVIIPREGFPMPDLHEMWVTVVDPLLPSAPEPSADVLKLQGGHELRAESNGHAVFHQMDDLDQDGVWDEIFFQTNLKPKEKRTFFIYLGQNNRGWNKHRTHAAVGSYCRHLMPFWETEAIGWKIWFANSVDCYSKREPLLMATKLYMDNIDGYGVSILDKSYGSDIQSVDISMGAGAVCLFEAPEVPDSVSMPRFTPMHYAKVPTTSWNAGQLSDTRYSYQVVVNGPIRSTVKIKGMNWNTENGSYAYEQTYTAYANQSYCISEVRFTQFLPRKAGVTMGCGLRKKPQENNFIQEGGLVVTSGPEGIRDPENIDDRKEHEVPFIGSAMIVPDRYKPQYRYVDAHNRNHTFSVTPDAKNSYQYMLLGGWSEGYTVNTKEWLNDYARKTHIEFNNPVLSQFVKVEEKK